MNTMIRGLGLVVLLGMAAGLSAADKEKQPKGETARPTCLVGWRCSRGSISARSNRRTLNDFGMNLRES